MYNVMNMCIVKKHEVVICAVIKKTRVVYPFYKSKALVAQDGVMKQCGPCGGILAVGEVVDKRTDVYTDPVQTACVPLDHVGSWIDQQDVN